MNWVLGLFALICLMLAAGAQAQTQSSPPLAPEGWTEQVQGNVRLLLAPSKAAFIYIKTGPMPDYHEIDFRDAVKGMYSDSKMSKCPDIEYMRTQSILEGHATELVVSENGVVCSALAGQYAGKGHMLYVMGANNDTIDASGKAREVMGRLMGLTQSGKPTQYNVQIPTGPMSRKASVESSGNYGVWVALVNRSVYDPVMTIRMELGVDYLILTKGGYFMRQLPDNGGLTDSAAQAVIKKDQDLGGRYTLSGNVLTLRYANGKVEQGRASKGGFELDFESYNPKRFFADGTALSGAYSSTSITSTGVGFVVGERDFDFTLDGRFGFGRAVSMSTTAISSTGEREGRGGRYYIKDSAIHLAYDDGERSVLPIWQESQGGPIWFDGQMYKPAGG